MVSLSTLGHLLEMVDVWCSEDNLLQTAVVHARPAISRPRVPAVVRDINQPKDLSSLSLDGVIAWVDTEGYAFGMNQPGVRDEDVQQLRVPQYVGVSVVEQNMGVEERRKGVVPRLGHETEAPQSGG